MAAIYSFLSSLCNSYELVPSKKDDDWGKLQAQQWVQSHPVNANISREVEKINGYVKEIIKDLKKVPITSANYDLIKDHLKEIACQSNAVRNGLSDQIFSCKGDPDLIKRIFLSIATIPTLNP
jgi:hypothetical protein